MVKAGRGLKLKPPFFAEPLMEEKRKFQRSRVLLVGQIVLDDRTTVYDCVIRNLSQTGAKLALPNAATVPELFELRIQAKDKALRAHVIWRTEKEVGVDLRE